MYIALINKNIIKILYFDANLLKHVAGCTRL
jgi:hypothetical protein